MEDTRLMQSMLLDFYGDLLTDKQRECFDLHVNDDLSLAEIAEQSGISRQGVWDNIRRAERALQEFENKTGLIERFNQNRRRLGELRELIVSLAESGVSGSLAGVCNEVIAIVTILTAVISIDLPAQKAAKSSK